MITNNSLLKLKTKEGVLVEQLINAGVINLGIVPLFIVGTHVSQWTIHVSVFIQSVIS